MEKYKIIRWAFKKRLKCIRYHIRTDGLDDIEPNMAVIDREGIYGKQAYIFPFMQDLIESHNDGINFSIT